MFVERVFVEDCEPDGILRVVLRSDETFVVGTPGIDDLDTAAPIVVRDEAVAAELEARLTLASRAVPQEWTFSVDDTGFTIRTDSSNIPVLASGASLYCLALPSGYSVRDHRVIHLDTGDSLPYLLEVDPSCRRQIIVVVWDGDDFRPFSIQVTTTGKLDPGLSEATRGEFRGAEDHGFDYSRLRGVGQAIGEGLAAAYIAKGLWG